MSPPSSAPAPSEVVSTAPLTPHVSLSTVHSSISSAAMTALRSPRPENANNTPTPSGAGAGAAPQAPMPTALAMLARAPEVCTGDQVLARAPHVDMRLAAILARARTSPFQLPDVATVLANRAAALAAIEAKAP